jgi:hypothetical protein
LEVLEYMVYGRRSQPTKYWNMLGLFWFRKYWKNIWHLLAGPYQSSVCLFLLSSAMYVPGSPSANDSKVT